MDNRARQELKEIINKHGPSVCDDSTRCEGFIRDYLGGFKKEAQLLINAMKEGIARDLLHPPANTTPNMLLPMLTKRLEDSLFITTDASNWAVESWAEALGMVPRVRVQSSQIAAAKNNNRSQVSSLGTAAKIVCYDEERFHNLSSSVHRWIDSVREGTFNMQGQGWAQEYLTDFLNNLRKKNSDEIMRNIKPLADKLYANLGKVPRRTIPLVSLYDYKDVALAGAILESWNDFIRALGL